MSDINPADYSSYRAAKRIAEVAVETIMRRGFNSTEQGCGEINITAAAEMIRAMLPDLPMSYKEISAAILDEAIYRTISRMQAVAESYIGLKEELAEEHSKNYGRYIEAAASGFNPPWMTRTRMRDLGSAAYTGLKEELADSCNIPMEAR